MNKTARFFLPILSGAVLGVHAETAVLRDLLYVDGGIPAQQLDLHLPDGYKTAPAPLPVVVVIHGGGWQNGDKSAKKFENWSRFYAENGYAAANLNYRLRPQHPFPAAIDDVKAAVVWLRAHAAEYNLATNRTASFGSSAGGHLAAVLGTSGGPAAVQAAIDFCGPSDIAAYAAKHKSPEAFTDALFGGAADPAAVRAASPLHTVTPQSAPFLIVHAADDPAVPIQHSRTLHEALQKAGVKSQLLELPSGGHGSPFFDAPETKQRILDFLRDALPKKP